MNQMPDKNLMLWRDRFDDHIRIGIFELLILQVLSEGDEERIDIQFKIGKNTDGVFCRSTSLYTALLKLTVRGLITFHTVQTDEAQNRILYHIEDSGIEYLEYGKRQLTAVMDGVTAFFRQEKRPLS